jgi:hypothetical protein
MKAFCEEHGMLLHKIRRYLKNNQPMACSDYALPLFPTLTTEINIHYSFPHLS